MFPMAMFVCPCQMAVGCSYGMWVASLEGVFVGGAKWVWFCTDSDVG